MNVYLSLWKNPFFLVKLDPSKLEFRRRLRLPLVRDSIKGMAYKNNGLWICIYFDGDLVWVCNEKACVKIQIQTKAKVQIDFVTDRDFVCTIASTPDCSITQKGCLEKTILLLDPLYDGLDFYYENFFAWLQRIVELSNTAEAIEQLREAILKGR